MKVFRAEKFYADEEVSSWLKEKSHGWTKRCDGKPIDWCVAQGYGVHKDWCEEVEE